MRAGFLAGAVAAALTVAGIGASGAAAAPSCTGESITGEGSSLQKVLNQNVLIPQFNTFTNGVNSCNGKVTYNGPGSGNGLKDWDFSGSEPFKHSIAFTASDDGPTTSQIGAAEAASGGNNIVVVPIAQTAITAFVNPPAECEVEEITNQQLEGIFNGHVLKWGQIDTAFGTGCAGKSITRVVRPVGSGTTYQFKNYLNSINPKALECTEGVGGKTWAQLEENGAEEKPNIIWPQNGVGGCEAGKSNQVTAIVRSNETAGLGTGGGDLVKKVNITNGSIGYAALPDVESNRGVTGTFENTEHDTHWLRIQNNGGVKLANAQFASPLVEANESANCVGAQYTVPATGRAGSGTGVSVDWSQVFGANKNISAVSGEEAYPLCTLTYDMAFTHYLAAGFTEGQESTVHDFVTEFATTESGQSFIANAKKWYAALPKSSNSARNVRGASQLAAGKIGL